MRGTVSAGMALALHELGLVPALDAVYGSSAGAITGAWLLSSTPEGLRGWADPDYARTLIRWSALLRGRPVVDVRTLVEEVYQTEFPMDFASILASPIEYHPLGTDAETGESTDLRPLISSPVELRLALRASASLPFLAGPPVELGGRRFYDAGVAESIPFRTPLAQGATHVLLLRSRRPLIPEQVDPQATTWTSRRRSPTTARPSPAGRLAGRRLEWPVRDDRFARPERCNRRACPGQAAFSPGRHCAASPLRCARPCSPAPSAPPPTSPASSCTRPRARPS